jgi:hypothetical protein
VRVGEVSYLVEDLSVPCEGPAYQLASAFNVLFVLAVVVGWPCFLVWYLRRLKHRGVTQKASVIDRVGFLFSKYKPDHIYHDVIETVRKLYLVTLVAFLNKGTMTQIVGSLFISVVAFGYHIYALPFTDPMLNMLQGACLFMIWLTLQAGMMLVATAPDSAAGTGVLIVATIANLIIMVSPAIMGALLFVKVVPKSIRHRVNTLLGLEDPELTRDAPTDGSDPDSDPHQRWRSESESDDSWMQSDTSRSRAGTSQHDSDDDDDEADEKRSAEPAPVRYFCHFFESVSLVMHLSDSQGPAKHDCSSCCSACEYLSHRSCPAFGCSPIHTCSIILENTTRFLPLSEPAHRHTMRP